MRPRRGLHLVAGLLIAVVLTACGASPSPVSPAPSPVPQIAPTDQPPDGSPGEILDSDEVPASQPPSNLRFERMGIEDGLSHSAVWKILQDREGYMWFGTQDGLNRYDGHSFTVYRHDPYDPQSLRDDYISYIYEDRSGALWIGTQAGWLEKYDRERGSILVAVVFHAMGNTVSQMFPGSTSNLFYWVVVGLTVVPVVVIYGPRTLVRKGRESRQVSSAVT